MLPYFTVTSNGYFEERGVQKSVLEDYFNTNQIAGSDDYAKMFLGKYWGSLKVMFNKDH